MAVNSFILADKRPFIKALEMISKQLYKYKPPESDVEVINVNLHLDHFTPYAIDRRQCRELLDGMLHSLDVTMNFPDRVKRNDLVNVSTAEIYYGLVENIPGILQNKLDSWTRVDQQKLAFQVFQELMENSHNRTAVKTHLLKFIVQENLSFQTEAEALNTLLDLIERFAQAINVLSKVVYLHRSIQEWSETLISAEEIIRKETDDSKVDLEVERVMKVYHDYINTFENFQAMGVQNRAAIYTSEILVESEPLAWISRLESPGFVQTGIDVLYLPVASENDFSVSLSNRLKDLLGTHLFQIQPFQPGPDAMSSLRNSREHIPPVPPDPARTSVPTVSFAVSTVSTPVSSATPAPTVMTPSRGAIVSAPVLQSTISQPSAYGSRGRAPAPGRGAGQAFSHSMDDLSEIRRPIINVDEYNQQCNQLMQHWNFCFSNNKSVLQGYPEALERQVQDLEREVKNCEEKEDSDLIDYLLNYDLERFQVNVTRARQGGVIDDIVAASYYKKHAKFVHRIKPLKRLLLKKIKNGETKKTLANLHKQNLPNMLDSLDSREWLEQVEFIMRALSEEEDNDPIIKNRVKDMVKASLKSDALKPLYKIINNIGDLEEMLHTIINYCSNQNNIMHDLRERLVKMKVPKTKMNMYSNCKLVVELIALLQAKDMIRVTSVSVYNLMVEKSLTASHIPKFEHFLNEALRKDNEQEDDREGMTDMEKKRFLLSHPQIRKKNLLNFKPLADLTMDKMAVLNDYLITHCTTFNLESDFTDTEKAKNTFFTKQEVHEDDSNDEGEENVSPSEVESLEANAHYTKSFKNRAEGHGEFCKVYLQFDRDYCKKMSDNPKMRDKLRRCPCGTSDSHDVPYGSLRYCPHFLQHNTLNARKEFLKLKRGCFKCLRGNHTSPSCRYKPASCYYCRLAGKPDKGHSPGMCAAFNNEEFSEIIKLIDSKLKSRADESEKTANVFTTEEGYSSDEDLENEDDLIEALNCHKIARHMSLQQELQFCEENGMEVEVMDHGNFKVTAGDERLQAIGDVTVRVESKEGEENEEGSESTDVLGLSDTGSEASFVTHQLAKKNRFKKLRILNLKLNTLGGVSNDKTFMYAVPIYHHKKKEFVTIEAAGVTTIGRAKMMTRELQGIVNTVLKPYNMSLTDLEVPRFDNISLIVGNDYAALQIEDNINLNKLSRPQNLRFYDSPIMKKPLVVGRAYGREAWTEAQDDASMVRPEIVVPSEQPVSQWEGFEGIRKKKEIVDTKTDMPWNDSKDFDCWEVKEERPKKVQSFYDVQLSEDELFNSDEEEEEEIYISCFMNNLATKTHVSSPTTEAEEDGRIREGIGNSLPEDDLFDSDDEGEAVHISCFMNNVVIGGNVSRHTDGINGDEEKEGSGYTNDGPHQVEDPVENSNDDAVDGQDGHGNEIESDAIDEEQLKNDSLKIRTPTVKELNILDTYLANEGNLPVQPSKCQECLEYNCKQCIKYSRASPAETSVLEEMKDKISQEEKPDGSIQYTVSYVTESPLSELFTPDVSNYSFALSQAKQVFSRFMATPSGREAVNTMVERGKRENHFRYLSEEETQQVLKGPHNFCSQTVAYKEASHSTKIRHVSNPSCLNKDLGSSLNIAQKNPGNIGNCSDWPLNAFLMYSVAYSADVKSAYRKLQVSKSDRKFQLLVLFNFSKDNWMDFPIIVEQVNLPFGMKQSGIFLELVLYEVGTKASSSLARTIICHFRLVDNLLYSFQTKELLESTGEEIFDLLEHHNLNLQHKYSTNKLNHYQFDVEQPQEVVLGFHWCKVNDTISPATVISHGRIKGGSKGRLLKDHPFSPQTITKRTILSVISQLFDPTGQFFSILKMSLKTIYSQICLAIPGKTKAGYDSPIIASSDYLAHVASDICNSLSQIHLIEPLKRNIVPQHFQVHHLILSKDGSSYGMATTLHIVSRNTQDHTQFHSRIARASNRAKITSAPTSESLSYVLGLTMIAQWLESVYHMFSNDSTHFDCFILGDSQSALQGLYTPPKDILFRSVQSKVLDLALNISTKFSKIRLQFVWSVAANNPSDLNSKITDRIIERSNSQFWRAGPPLFLSHEQLLQSTYAKFDRETKRFVVVKQLTEQNPNILEDDQIQVADISEVCLKGTKQQQVTESTNDKQAIAESGDCFPQGGASGDSSDTFTPAEACTPTSGVISTAPTQPQDSKGRQVTSSQDTESADSKDILSPPGAYQPPSGEPSKDPACLQNIKVKTVPSLRLSSNIKNKQLQPIYPTQCNAYISQRQKKSNQPDVLTGTNNDDMSDTGKESDDNDDDNQSYHDNDHHQNDGDDVSISPSQNNRQRSIYDWDLNEKDNTPAQESAWFDNTPSVAQFTTLTHRYFFTNNISLSQLFHSGGLDLALPHTHPIQIGENKQIYESLLDKSGSLGSLLARTIYQYVNPLIWVEKARLTLKQEKIPVFDLKNKFQLAWHFLILNSQKLYPPSRMQASHDIFEENGLSCIGLKVDFRLFRPVILPLIGRDEKLLQLIFNQAHSFTGLDGKNYHQSISSTASQIRSSGYGVFFLNSQKVVSYFVKQCIPCAKDKGSTIISKIASYHRIRVEAPFSRILIDILGPWTVKAGCNSRALIKVHALIAVCLSTGLLTHIMTDSITTEAVIRALWVLQMRHGTQITHIHSDRGTQFLNIGAVGSIPNGSPGQFIRLLIMVNAIRISAARGQSSNVVEPSVRRLKDLWRSGSKNVAENRGSSFCQLDWLLAQLCSDLNKVPLQPSISNIAPSDFSLAYKQLPVGFQYHDTKGNKKMINQLSEDYKKLSEGLKNDRLLSPYLWRTKYLGQVTRSCNTNDVVFVKNIRKLGLVCKIRQTQLQIRYMDSSGKPRRQWFKKSDITHLLAGSTFLTNPLIPEHEITESLTNK